MWGRKVICVRCINCLHNNTAKSIRLHDKIAIFIYTEKKFIQVRAFESNTSLNHPPYSPDLDPSNYYLFRNLKSDLRGTRFRDDDEPNAGFVDQADDYRLLLKKMSGPNALK